MMIVMFLSRKQKRNLINISFLTVVYDDIDAQAIYTILFIIYPQQTKKDKSDSVVFNY